jgi:hypothetical protein
MGIGEILAYHLLSEVIESVEPFSNGVVTAIYIVEKVKQNVEGCGGLTQVGVAYSIPDSDESYTAKVRRAKGLPLPFSEACILDQNEINDLVNKVTDVDFRCRQNRNEKIIEMIKGIEAGYQKKWEETPEEVQ